MRWYPYKGFRLFTAGKRTYIEDRPSRDNAPLPRRYGCVWETEGQFWGYYEVMQPGQIEDIHLGPFSTDREAKRAVEARLLHALDEDTDWQFFEAQWDEALRRSINSARG